MYENGARPRRLAFHDFFLRPAYTEPTTGFGLVGAEGRRVRDRGKYHFPSQERNLLSLPCVKKTTLLSGASLVLLATLCITTGCSKKEEAASGNAGTSFGLGAYLASLK